MATPPPPPPPAPAPAPAAAAPSAPVGGPVLLFNGGMPELAWLDNIACQVPITLGGLEYPSSEHYFQAQKFAHDERWREAVRGERDPLAAKRLGRRGPLRADWEEVKVQVMEEAVFAKFAQHAELRRLLLATHPLCLVERAPDACWGDGGDSSGRNLFGLVLGRVRVRLRERLREEGCGTDGPVELDGGDEASLPSPAGASAPLAAVIERAAVALAAARAVLVVAGAGMGVDSGLRTVRDSSGSYTLEDYHDKCQFHLFVGNPHAAWDFHGAVLRRFRAVAPHDGFSQLQRICQAKAGHFVCTSNVDGQFEKAGFLAAQVFNAHGSMHYWQCMSANCNKAHDPWPAGEWRVGELPQCRYCKSMARPNVSFFDDNQGRYADSLNGRMILNQFARFEAWLRHVASSRWPLCILEIGCGESEHSLRLVPEARGRWACMSDEWGKLAFAGSLVRVNPAPGAGDAAGDLIHVPLGAREALQLLAEALDSDPRPAAPAGGAAAEVRARGVRRKAPRKR